jgi:hypothetical protein
VRYLVGLPLGTRTAPSRTAIGDFRRAVVAAGLETELFDQQVKWLGSLPALVDPRKDDFGIDATRFEAAVAQPTIIGLLQHGLRRYAEPCRSSGVGALLPQGRMSHLRWFFGGTDHGPGRGAGALPASRDEQGGAG